jgi:hypothetical protein
MDKFKTKSGRLTPYALACGYIETKEVSGVTFSLFLDGCKHVQARSNEKGRFLWECFDTLTQARKFFDSQALLISKGEKPCL